MTVTRPSRAPLACGALGRYDASLTRQVAGNLNVDMAVAHEDDESILLVDRPPISWRSQNRRGFAWSESPDAPGRPRSWREAARDLAACGLVVEPGRRRLHTSVSGVAPIYYLVHDRAIYFASRIDPLVRAIPGSLSVDWRAWASIFCLRFPLGVRTPFREVKRLRAYCTLEWDARRDRQRVHESTWPWAEVEPHRELQAGADALIEAMKAAAAPLGNEPVVCTLSGGRDSRLILALLADSRHSALRALTVNPDNGHRREEELAARVTAELDVPHEVVQGDPDAFWEDTRQRALRVDYQLAAPPWAMPMVTALRGKRATVTDGLALDTFAQAGGRFYTEEMLSPSGAPTTARALWRRMLGKTMRRMMKTTFTSDFVGTLKPMAQRQFMNEAARFRGHPAEPALVFYVTRTLRGISLAPHAALGAEAATATPFTDDGVARACLAIRPREKFNGRIYEALFARINPRLGRIPSSHDMPEAPPTQSRRGLSAAAIRGYERVLGDGPLMPVFNPEFREHLRNGTLRADLEADPAVHRGVLAATLFHLWHERYAGRLSAEDQLAELGVTTPA